MKNIKRVIIIALILCLGGLGLSALKTADKTEAEQEKEIDSDGDGLSNYVEIYVSQTDPKENDTDFNGIADAEEDLDLDRMTNRVEIELGTDLDKADSDKDTISDFDEINIYQTDPVQYDSDGDALSDGDELLLGLNPLEAKTDGDTLDSERIFTQQLSDDKIAETLLEEENQAKPSLELDISGNINKKAKIEQTNSGDFTDSRAVVGEPIEIKGECITEGTLSFEIAEESTSFIYGENEADKYNANLICKYNDDGTTEYLETNFDEVNNRISAEIETEGTYFVLNVETLVHEIAMSSIAADETAGYTAMSQADIVFVIDTTGSMREEINSVKENVSLFVDSLYNQGISAQLALVTYEDIDFDGFESTRVHKNDDQNWYRDIETYKTTLENLPLGRGGDLSECAVDGLETARLLDMRESAGKVFVLLTDAAPKDDNRYGIPSMDAEIELLKNAGVNCYVVSSAADKEAYHSLYSKTDGLWADITGNFQNTLSNISDKIGTQIVGEGYWIYLQGPVPVPIRLDAKPEEGSEVDTDKDGIPDVIELEGAAPTGTIDLDALIEQISKGAITGTTYGTVNMYRYNSNPTAKDTDFDGTDDAQDSAPNNSRGTGVMHYTIDGTYYPCNIEFNMDYRQLITGDNTVYTKDLSMLSVLYATDVYDVTYIEVSDFAKTGGSDIGTNFGDLLGLEDSRYMAVNGADYMVDQDDITDFYVGHKNFVYNGKAHEVIVVSVRGTDGTFEEWSSNFDIGADTADYYRATGNNHPHWRNRENHKGFDVTANRVLDKLLPYIEEYVNPYSQKSILITGHSRGAAIANILGKYFEDQADYRSYTYTFATPSTTTDPNAPNYETIFNVLNTDDMITFIPLDSWGFSKYGESTAICVEDFYENELGAEEEGCWEWFMGQDYDNDYNTQNTLKAFAKIAENREDMYVLGETDSEKVWEDDLGHTTMAGAEEELASLSSSLENEKLRRFCDLYIVNSWFVYHVEINYCPAYLLQTLANMTTGVGPLLGRDVAGVYADAKTAFVASSGKLVIGGMTHPHMPPTYYIMTYHNLESLY